MSPERLRQHLASDLRSAFRDRDSAVLTGNYDLARELEKSLQTIKKELFGLDTSILRDKHEKEREDFGVLNDPQLVIAADLHLDDLWKKLNQDDKDQKLTDTERKELESQETYLRNAKSSAQDRIDSRNAGLNELAFEMSLETMSARDKQAALESQYSTKKDKIFEVLESPDPLTDKEYEKLVADIGDFRGLGAQLKQLESNQP